MEMKISKFSGKELYEKVFWLNMQQMKLAWKETSNKRTVCISLRKVTASKFTNPPRKAPVIVCIFYNVAVFCDP